MAIPVVTHRFVLVLLLALAVPAAAIEWTSVEGIARGFPVLRDQSGRKIADGDFMQWIEDGRLHVRITYTGRTRQITERAVFRQRPELAQEAWSLHEFRNGTLYRQFEVNFRAGTAAAKKHTGDEQDVWSEKVELDRGRAFAGFGFTLAVKALRTRLGRGEHVELQAVGFAPKPRVVTVEISYGGIDRVRMADRVIRGERFIVHPKLPPLAGLFVDVPDAKIWLTAAPGPAAFLRWEGPLAEPGDDIVRVDLLPGGSSEPAVPIEKSDRGD